MNQDLWHNLKRMLSHLDETTYFELQRASFSIADALTFEWVGALSFINDSAHKLDLTWYGTIFRKFEYASSLQIFKVREDFSDLKWL